MTASEFPTHYNYLIHWKTRRWRMIRVDKTECGSWEIHVDYNRLTSGDDVVPVRITGSYHFQFQLAYVHLYLLHWSQNAYL